MSPGRHGSTRELTLRTSSPAETRRLAGTIARSMRPGDCVVLTGELGAGKTCFVQGAASTLGVQRRVTSPTYTIVRSYTGDVEVVHVDVYRLDALQDFVELGEENVLGADQITFIEWGDTVDALLPDDRLEVEIMLGEDDEARTVRLRGHGGWAGRIVDLVGDLGVWLLDGTDG